MAFNVMIVDDDRYMRLRLRRIIQELSLNVQIVGEIADGKKALSFIDTCGDTSRPNLVFLDVEMAVMDGIETTRLLKQRYPGIKVVIVSNYDNFDYVQSTLTGGAIDYILKMRLTPEVVEQCLDKAGFKAFKDTTQERDISVTFSEVAGIFDQLTTPGNVVDTAAVQERLMRAGLKMKLTRMMPAVLYVEQYSNIVRNKPPEFLSNMSLVISELLNNSVINAGAGIYRHVAPDRYYILFDLTTRHSDMNMNGFIRSVAGSIIRQVKADLNISVSFALAGPVTKIPQIADGFCEAEELLRQGKHLGRERILQGTHQKNDGERVFFQINTLIESELETAVLRGDSQTVQGLLKDIFDSMEKNELQYTYCQMIYSDLVVLIHKYCKTYEIEYTDFWPGGTPLLQSIQAQDNIQDTFCMVRDLFSSMLRYTQGGLYTSYKVKHTLRYINENFERDITLTEVADKVQLNSSYLSKLLKDQTGLGFSEWLNRARIERSILLIGQGRYSLRQISEMCGYNYYNYFISQFKKIIGISPNTHCKRLERQIPKST